MVSVIIAAAGQGKRMGRSINKVFIPLGGKPILEHTVSNVCSSPQVKFIVVTAAEDEVAIMTNMLTRLGLTIPWQVVVGGSERQYSIANALKVIPPDTTVLVVHDGARPLADQSLLHSVIDEVRKSKAVITAVPVKDTIKNIDKQGYVTGTPDRSALWAVQTPQAFASDLLISAYDRAKQEGYLGTDDASLVERLGIKVKVVSGDYRNIKITTPEDIVIAEAILRQREVKKVIRSGIGYDVHRLVTGRPLILGGVEIPYSFGLDGHSDADVLLHAIKDALLGAAALGDIGRHFPDTDGRYKGISSLKLLAKVGEILTAHGYAVNNIDATIVAQKPKLAPYIQAMNHNIAEVLGLDLTKVNVKATTTEGLGFAGQGEGIASYATATIIAQPD